MSTFSLCHESGETVRACSDAEIELLRTGAPAADYVRMLALWLTMGVRLRCPCNVLRRVARESAPYLWRFPFQLPSTSDRCGLCTRLRERVGVEDVEGGVRTAVPIS